VARIEQVLDKYCLAHVQISPESRVKVAAGAAAARLVEQGWRTFLVRVDNEAGVTAELRVRSPNAGKLANSPADEIRAESKGTGAIPFGTPLALTRFNMFSCISNK
jgi:hypothetical protein